MNRTHLISHLLFLFLVLNRLLSQPIPPVDKGTSLGCGFGDNGEPQATASVEFGGHHYQHGTLILFLDWGDGHRIRQSHNLTEIHGTGLNFVHEYENVTDPNKWSYPLVFHPDAMFPEEEDELFLMWRMAMTCGMSQEVADNSATLSGKISLLMTLAVAAGSFWLVS